MALAVTVALAVMALAVTVALAVMSSFKIPGTREKVVKSLLAWGPGKPPLDPGN
jgi:hypothetical protein